MVEARPDLLVPPDADPDVLYMWVVTYDTIDYPHQYAIRIHEIYEGESRPTNRAAAADTLEEVRAMIPPGLHRLPKSASDEPVIMESWV